VICILLPVTDILFIYPAFKSMISKNTKDEAVGLARLLMSENIRNRAELHRNSFSHDEIDRLKQIALNFKLAKLKIFSKSGEVVFSTDAKDIGYQNRKSYFHDSVAQGSVYTKVVQKGTRTLEGQNLKTDVVETYVPIMNGNDFIGAFEIYYDITTRKKNLDRLVFRSITLLLILAASFLIIIVIVLMKTGQDVYRREQAEAALRVSQEELLKAKKLESISSLSGGIAHEFNNILASVTGYAQLALDDAENEPILQDNLQRVLHAGKRAKKLVEQILIFSRQSEEKLIPLQLKQIVEETVQPFMASVPPNVEVQCNINSDAFVMADRTELDLMLKSLCSNAVFAMPANGGVLAVTIDNKEPSSDLMAKFSTLKLDKYMRLTVSDSGCGIAPENLSRVFDPFFTTREPGEGTGLGLAMVHSIVTRHGGMITVESEPGQGATFSIFLPVIPDPIFS